MSPFIAEFIGTAILIIFGNGVVANVVLSRTKGNGGGWIVIAFGWGMAVFVGAFCVAKFSDAHLNPAVSIGLAAAGKFGWAMVPAYIAAQMLGAFVGAVVVYLHYNQHFKATEDQGTKLACFSTGPNLRHLPSAFFCEVVGTFLLVLPILLIVGPSFTLAAVKGDVKIGVFGPLPVGLLVFAIGLSLGGTTGYAINPARDLGPRIAHAILPIPGKGTSDWGYAWIPVIAPIFGALLAGLAMRLVTP